MDNELQYHFTFDRLDEIDTALGTAEDKIQKAAALNGDVLTNYLSAKTPDRDKRDKAAYLTSYSSFFIMAKKSPSSVYLSGEYGVPTADGCHWS